jgi:hypothetical protein
MINLTSSTHELRIKLGSVPTGSPPNECQCVIGYRQTTDTTYEFGSNATLSTNTSSKTLLNCSSAASTIRVIDDISIYNPDGTIVVSIIFYDGTTEWILVKQTLLTDETLTYNDKFGWGLN